MSGLAKVSRNRRAVRVATQDWCILKRHTPRPGAGLARWRSVAVLLALVLAAASASGARVESFSPQGFNKDVRQVAVRFSAAMVALGDPGRTSPFVVDCPIPGTGRWIDERHWVYDFEYEVPGAVM